MSGSKAPDTIIIEERQNRRKDIMKIGFIGLGNMATAMIGGMLQKGIAAPEDIIGSARTETTVEKVKTKFNINTTTDNKIVAAQADILFLAVKPIFFPAGFCCRALRIEACVAASIRNRCASASIAHLSR